MARTRVAILILAGSRSVTKRKKERYLAGIQHGSGNTRPCIHGLRHTFAMSRMLEWYHCGLPVNDLLPNLSIYMGHTKPACTYWYLTALPELLSAAGDCFQKFANQ